MHYWYTIGALMVVFAASGAIAMERGPGEDPAKVPVLVAANAQPATDPGAKSAPPASQPAPPPAWTFEAGFEGRVRTENWDNIMDFEGDTPDTRRQWRFRTRAWGKLALGDRALVAVGLDNESRKIAEPDQPFKFDETIFETLYADVKLGGGWSVQAGRQNITRGDGFIFMDGSALDGSRTVYFNAAVLRVAVKQSTLDFIGISNPRRDIYLPVFHDKHKLLNEWDEQAGAVYYADRNSARAPFDLYFVRKWENDDDRLPSHAQFQPDRAFNTIGGRAARVFDHGFRLTGEAAYQWGEQDDDTETRGWAGVASLKKELGGRRSPVLSAGWIGLSGDDSGTAKREDWDPMFSRWPKWSEGYIYTQATEYGVAYWTNLSMWYGELTVKPTPKLLARATVFHMSAFHPFTRNEALYGGGTDRGDMIEGRLDFTLNSRFRGHVLYEGVLPGDFYRGGDKAYWIRFEVICLFKKTFPLAG